MTRTILTVALAAIFGVGGTIASRIQTAPEEDASELALKNIEALGNEEQNEPYKNGFRVFTAEKGGAYDCEKIWHEYKPDPQYPCL